MTITNNYLKKSIDEMGNFLVNHTNVPEDLIFKLLVELRVSNLLIPARMEENQLSFSHIETGNQKLLPLFTDEEAFTKYSDEFEPVENDFEYYQHIVNDLNFDGIVINSEDEGFVIERKLIKDVKKNPEHVSTRGFDAEKLRNLAFSNKNMELLGFIRNEANFRNYDDLKNILFNTILLNPVVSNLDLKLFEDDGIIKRSEVGGFSLVNKKVGQQRYGTLYTDIDTLKKSGFEHFQVTNLFEVFRAYLASDLDGVILNPDYEEYVITRNAMLEMIDDDKIISRNLAGAVEYAFAIR